MCKGGLPYTLGAVDGPQADAKEAGYSLLLFEGVWRPILWKLEAR